MSAIDVRGLRFRYAADEPWRLDGVDLHVAPGEIVLLEGGSGSGKSTLLRVLAGLAPAFHGGEADGGGAVAGLPLRTTAPAALAQRVGLLFQDPETQAVMAEPLRDVAFSLQCHGRPAAAILPSARGALARVQADHLVGRRIDRLSAGERQRVALAAVLAPEPEVLLLDEPTAQIDDDAACELVGELRRLADRGLAIVIAEHRRDRVGHLTDRVLGMAGGRLGPARTHPPLGSASPPTGGDSALVLDGLRARRPDAAEGLVATAALSRGCAAALIGRNGSGKSTLLRAVAGLDPAEGTVIVGGDDVSALAPEARTPRIAMVPQDPGRTLLTDSIRDEVLLGPRLLGLDHGPAERALEDLDLLRIADRNPRDCSVGERERVAIAAALAVDPAVLLLDEPTRGMDPAHRADLVAVLDAHARRGGSTVLATHDLDLARACAQHRWAIAGGTLEAV